ncbi:hypothetical protein KEM48_000528 [Puccinia striiformis f. sp. tritici PST-130]|nr:hypothetical protein KEM48_000528 [Puccinia striiformis f. sp. tritici PST-130]
MVMEFCPGGTLQKLVQLHASTSVITTTLPERPDSDKIDLSPKSNGIGPVIARKFSDKSFLGSIIYIEMKSFDHKKDYDINQKHIVTSIKSNKDSRFWNFVYKTAWRYSLLHAHWFAPFSDRRHHVNADYTEEWDAEIVDLMSKILDKHADSRLKMAALKRHNG